MKRLSGLLIVVLLLLVTACSGEDKAEPKPAGKTTKTADSITITSLGGAEWPAGDSALSLDDVPKAPGGYTQVQVAQLAETVIKWAKVASLDKRVFDAKSPLDFIKPTLPFKTFTNLAISTVTNGVVPRLNAANVFADDVEIVGQPRQTSVWNVTAEKPKNGYPYLYVVVQTRTAYEVKSEAGSRVIGVVREHGLRSDETGSTVAERGTSWYWVEYAADDCAMAQNDALVPQGDLAKAKDELKEFLTYFNAKKYRKVELSPDNQTDEKLLKRCKDEAPA